MKEQACQKSVAVRQNDEKTLKNGIESIYQSQINALTTKTVDINKMLRKRRATKIANKQTDKNSKLRLESKKNSAAAAVFSLRETEANQR